MFRKGLTIWYSVKDIDVTKSFYENVLGFSVQMYDPDNNMVIMDLPTPDTTIGFSSSETLEPSQASVVFGVINIDESVKELTSKGIKFIGEIEIIPGLAKLATFTDPDGNSLMLEESLIDDN